MFGLRMPKKLTKGTIILFVLAATITGFTSLKTIDLLKFTMPPDQAAFAWFGWACFEGGLAAWIFFSSSGARRDQRTIAQIMVWFNLIAVAVAFFADTVLVIGRKGDLQVDSGIITWTVIIAVCVVVIANLVAVVGTHQSDPDTRKRIKQEEYQEALEEAEEEAQHRIEIERLKYIIRNAAAIAPQIGYQQGQDWMQQQYQRWALPGMQALPAPQPQQLQQQAQFTRQMQPENEPTGIQFVGPDGQTGYISMEELAKLVEKQGPLVRPVPTEQAGQNGNHSH